ncbi:TetR/AcrR family transcriptional regulator [Amycolatopsis taiwanensis]|uniref:TetR/AcrR family transcriptional regulator n=1 Tax=Amycolatopsis taiwanensis TaxID=342230 RepID=UPI002554B6B0|nr:TetR/AcrR family transcriptional regulator [Amycolatopsis taiwanensis]
MRQRTGQAGRKLMRRDDRRAQILGCAITLFARRGFRESSLDDIAAEAGITRAVVYRHFDSKEDLYRAALDDARTAVRAEIGADVGVGPGSVEGLVRAAQRDPDRFRMLFANARHEPEFVAYYEEFDDRSAQFVRDALPEGFATGEATEWFSRLIPRLMFEAILTWLDHGQPVPPDTLADMLRASSQGMTARLGKSHRSQVAGRD